MQTIEQLIQNHEDRIKALEARQPKPHNTPETNPFMGRQPQSEPYQPPSEAFMKVFGRVHIDDQGRALDKWEENTWNRRLKSWGGVAAEIPQSDAVDALLDAWERLRGIELSHEYINYGFELALVFPTVPGLGYGTPNCYVLAVSLIEADYGEEKKIDRVIELIEKRMAKG